MICAQHWFYVNICHDASLSNLQTWYVTKWNYMIPSSMCYTVSYHRVYICYVYIKHNIEYRKIIAHAEYDVLVFTDESFLHVIFHTIYNITATHIVY